VLFTVGFALPAIFLVAQVAAFLLLVILFLDLLLLFRYSGDLSCVRKLPKLLNMGDQNRIALHFEQTGARPLHLTIIEELPLQLEERAFRKKLELAPDGESTLTYHIRPTERGRYQFGLTNVFISGPVGLIDRRLQFEHEQREVPVYPSVLQMKEMELRAMQRLTTQQGIKKIRRIGHSYEFEQIKNYVRGDDYRSINWKASSRRATLMVNQYEDERSQQVYCVIDKSRAMRLPFEGLTLMDHAINTVLSLSNVVLRKYDRSGLITFSDKIGATLKADSRPGQINKILNTLYAEEERAVEASFELLYFAARKLITGRSLMLLFTNFESNYALDRVIDVLRRINRLHLLVVVFFENTEISDFAHAQSNDLQEIYQRVVAEKFTNEKHRMAQRLRQYGIQAVLTRPEDLSIDAVNKYLELKSRGLI